MPKESRGGITPILTVNEKSVIVGHNAAAVHALPGLRIGTKLEQYALVGMTDDPVHYTCYRKESATFCAYRSAAESEFRIFPGLLQHHTQLLSGGFLPDLEEADHEHLNEMLFAMAEGGILPAHYAQICRLDRLLINLCNILLMDMKPGELADVTAILELLRARMIAAFEKLGCTLRIDTVELTRGEIYPILPVVWLYLLINLEMLLLHTSSTCRLALQFYAEKDWLAVEMTADGAPDALDRLAGLEVAFDRIIANRCGMEITLSSSVRGTRLSLTQPLRYGGELVLHAPQSFAIQRREAMLAEFDRLLGL